MTVMLACTTVALRVWVPSVVEKLSVATPPFGNPLNELLTAPVASVMLTLPLTAPPTGVRVACATPEVQVSGITVGIGVPVAVFVAVTVTVGVLLGTAVLV
jgi:hypothetical protein